MTVIRTKKTEWASVLNAYEDKIYKNRYLGQFCKLSGYGYVFYPEAKSFQGARKAEFFQAIADKLKELNDPVLGLRNNDTQQWESV